MIDNSASMLDLAYADTRKKHCSTTTSTACSYDTDCPSGETCSAFDRSPFYCYDQSYKSTNVYEGYFDRTKNYHYVFNTTYPYFEEVASIPSTCAMAASSTVICKQRAGVLHVNIDTASGSTATKYFYASGNFLNWLTASKLDVEKKILTGGK